MKSKIRRKKKVLFVCTHNSGRSVMAETLVNQLYGHEYEAESADLRPGDVNPIVAQVLAEKCIDVSDYEPRALFEVIKVDQIFAKVITICDENLDKRPIFPGVTERVEWSFPDPSACTGTRQQKRADVRRICEAIKAQVEIEFSS